MLGYKKIYKVTNLKFHSKRRYFVKKKSPFKNYNERLQLQRFGIQLVFRVCDIIKRPIKISLNTVNPAYGNLNGWRVGETAC